jgi:hypothetical protein
MFITTENNIKSSETEAILKKRRRTSLSLLVSVIESKVMESNQMMMSPIQESLQSAGLVESPNSFETRRFGALNFPVEMQSSWRRSTRVSVQNSDGNTSTSSAHLEYIHVSPWQEHSSEEILFGKSIAQNISNRVTADHYKVNNRVSADHYKVSNRLSDHYSWNIRGQNVDLSFTDEFRDLGNNIKLSTLNGKCRGSTVSIDSGF